MLGTVLLAHAALEAVGGLAVIAGQNIVVIIILIPAVKGGFQIVAGEQRADLIGPGEEMGGELVREDVLVPGIAGSQGLTQGQLALAAEVAVGRIEIVEAGGEKGVHHVAKLRHIHLAVYHRQAHAAKAEFAVDLGKK